MYSLNLNKSFSSCILPLSQPISLYCKACNACSNWKQDAPIHVHAFIHHIIVHPFNNKFAICSQIFVNYVPLCQDVTLEQCERGIKKIFSGSAFVVKLLQSMYVKFKKTNYHNFNIFLQQFVAMHVF